jgi:hypothetical protein
MLSPIDSVSVIAVDSAAHLVVPLSSAKDRAAISAQTRRIESMGGGIYVGAALEACASQLQASSQQNRHIVLFADAADAEEPGDYRTFVPSLAAAGVTVSVIGLGSPADSDAALLQEIAKLGNGRCHFVGDAADLPRVFAQETIQVARSAVVEERTKVRAMAPLATLGDLPLSFPDVGGYSVAWRRDRGELDLEAEDDLKAPILSHWQHGLGRAAALLAEVDGPLTGDLADWDRLGTFLATLVRWLGGGQTPGVFVEARRQGADGIFAVEVEEAQAALLDRVRGVLTLPDGAIEELPFERQSPTRLAARVPLTGAGAYRAALEVDGAAFRLPPLALPYSPELAPQPDARLGERNLRRLALVTGGGVQPSAKDVVQGERESLGREDFGALCAWLLLTLFFVEVAARRFHWTVPTPAWLARLLKPNVPAAPAVELRDAPRPAPKPIEPSVPAPPPAAPPAPSGVLDALDKAKRRTRPR